MQNDFDRLLEKLGIARSYTDAAQNHKKYEASDETLLNMVNYLGFPLKSIAGSGELLHRLEKQRIETVLEPVYTAKSGDVRFDAVLKAADAEKVKVSLCTEGKEIPVIFEREEKERMSSENGTEYVRFEYKITTPLEPQYYELRLTAGGSKYRSVLAVAPEKCYIPEAVQNGKIWGFAVQLYALASKRNWGVGDFSDLAALAAECGKLGANVIGVNPLNVLSNANPESASPYSSISRLFLNPLYIDVENVPGFEKEDVDYDEITKIKQKENIDYKSIYNLKLKVLDKIYKRFCRSKRSKKYAAFEEFCREKGGDLEDLAAYQLLSAKYSDNWQIWPDGLSDPHSAATVKFKEEHEKELGFFKFLQYVAEKQFAGAEEEIKKAGLLVGLYRDLPVGLNKNSAELWCDKDLFIDKCGAGAPPDVFFPTGQKWCLGAFNRFELKKRAYLPFIKVLRAAMAGAGALRIDHVMSLMRLYIIPDASDNGTYVYYDFDDMLNIVALESYLNKCMVVGESIGNVPDGFIEKIRSRGLYSLSVLWAERYDGFGDFKRPCDFPRTAFCSVGTHDMPPLKMRWFGYDIETMYNLGMLSDDERQSQYKGREDERWRLLCALDAAGVWPSDRPRQGNCLYGEGYPDGITEAVEKYVSSSACAVYLAQLEDIFGVTVLQNLPGTDEATYPNWRRKVPVNIEDYDSRDDFRKAVASIKSER